MFRLNFIRLPSLICSDVQNVIDSGIRVRAAFDFLTEVKKPGKRLAEGAGQTSPLAWILSGVILRHLMEPVQKLIRRLFISSSQAWISASYLLSAQQP